MSHLSLRLLGSPQVARNGVSVELATRKVLALLAYLAVTDHAHSRDALAALLWPEAEQGHARGSLRHALARLRESLGEQWLESQGELVRVRSDDSLTVDVRQFLAQVAVCHSH